MFLSHSGPSPIPSIDQRRHCKNHRQFSRRLSTGLYANSVLYGTSLTNIKRLQRVQNGLARVVARLPTRSPTTPTLNELHWLPIRHRSDYKIATLTYKVLDCGEPTYLHSRISFCVSRRELRSSADTRRLNALRTKTVIAGRAFRSSAPAVWNALPLDVRSAS